MPLTARRYIEAVEARTGIEVSMVSVGAERDATIVRSEVLR